MNGVRFGEYHSYNDLSLILATKTIGTPRAKTSVIDVPGGDGELDCTEYFGDVKYSNRTLSFEFSTIVHPSEFLTLYSRVQNLFNGQKMEITLDDDPDFYYVGRVSVNEWKSSGRIGKIALEVNAEPYKLKRAKTVVMQTFTEPGAINCRNLRMRVMPKITASGATTIKFGKQPPIKLAAGAATENENIIFTHGQNVLEVIPESGMTTVTIEYQEGEL